MAALLTFVKSRLDYLALHREMNRAPDQLQKIENSCLGAMIKAVQRVSTIDIGTAQALATAIRDSPDLHEDSKVAVLCELDSRTCIDDDTEISAVAMTPTPALLDAAVGADAGPNSPSHMTRLQT